MREEPEPGRAGRAMEETAAPGIKVVGGRLGRRAAGRQAGRQAVAEVDQDRDMGARRDS